MIVTCWSVKGGSGTSVVAGGLAVAWSASRPVLAVDLAGDLPSVLGLPAAAGPGVGDWLRAGRGVGAGALHALATEAGPHLRLVHRGTPGAGDRVEPGGPGTAAERWADLRAALEARSEVVLIDAGTGPLPPELAAMSQVSLLVIRPCFLALRRVPDHATAPTGVVVIDEPGRALRRRDVEQVVGVRVAAETRVDPAVARAVDAGLLAARLPASLHQLARAVDRWADRVVAPAGPAPASDTAADDPAPAGTAAAPWPTAATDDGWAAAPFAPGAAVREVGW